MKKRTPISGLFDVSMKVYEVRRLQLTSYVLGNVEYYTWTKLHKLIYDQLEVRIRLWRYRG